MPPRPKCPSNKAIQKILNKYGSRIERATNHIRTRSSTSLRRENTSLEWMDDSIVINSPATTADSSFDTGDFVDEQLTAMVEDLKKVYMEHFATNNTTPESFLDVILSAQQVQQKIRTRKLVGGVVSGVVMIVVGLLTYFLR